MTTTKTTRTTTNSNPETAPPSHAELVAPDRDEQREIDALLRHFGNGDDARPIIYKVLDNQLSVLHGRAQSLVQVAGVVITVTGFSGRIIADTNTVAQSLIVFGLIFVSLAAALALIFVMPIRWVSSYLHLPMDQWILVTLRRRQKKSRAVRVASAILVFGMLLYIGSIAIMLMNPQATELKLVR